MTKEFKSFNWNIYAQTAPASELYEFDRDNRDDIDNDFQAIDYDEYEKNLPAIYEEDINDYLVDNFEEENAEELDKKRIEEQEPEVPIEITDEEVPEFDNKIDGLNWAIQNNKVIRLNYITKKGIDLQRIVEPHHIFVAGTGNDIVVTFDRSIRGTRAYIVDNIVDYSVTGKEFKKRLRILPTGGKVEPMNNGLFDRLGEISNELEKEGLVKTSFLVTDSMKELLDIKTAQYVGLQGYWVRNHRCWQNCYRQKRVNEANAQKVWFECLEEYQKSINNDGTEWDKYAEGKDNKLLKEASKNEYNKEDKIILSRINKKVKEGMGVGESVFITLEERGFDYFDKTSNVAQKLIFIADDLKDAGYENLSKKTASVSLELAKEAQFFFNDKSKFRPEGFLGKTKELLRGGRGGKKNIIDRLTTIGLQAGDFATQLSNINYYYSGQQERKTPAQPQTTPSTQPPLQPLPKDLVSVNTLSPGDPRYKTVATPKQDPTTKGIQRRDQRGRFQRPAPLTESIMASTKTAQLRQNVTILNRQLIDFINGLSSEASYLARLSARSKDPEVKNLAGMASQEINDFFQTSGVAGLGNQLSRNANFLVTNSEMANTIANLARKLQRNINTILSGGAMSQSLPDQETAYPTQGKETFFPEEVATEGVQHGEVTFDGVVNYLDRLLKEDPETLVKVYEAAGNRLAKLVSGRRATGT